MNWISCPLAVRATISSTSLLETEPMNSPDSFSPTFPISTLQSVP